jgi:hypothetical protein
MKLCQWTAAFVLLLACPRLMAEEAQPAGATNDPNAFTIIALPDTQVYSKKFPEIFRAQTEWIKANKDALNIACVVHEGDITGGSSDAEWQAADAAMRVLDGVVPYCLAMGNHDYGGPKPRNAAAFNKYFGPDRFQDQPWYGGHFEKGNENAWYTFRAAGMDFLVLCLEFGPRDKVLEWAGKIVAEHKDRRVIVVTHCYAYSDDTRVGKGDKWNPHDYGWPCNDGDELWEKFGRKHPNIFLVLSGHILNDGAGRLTSVGDNGNRVHELLANYQTKGRSGLLRILTFLPASNRIEVRTYSPVTKTYLDDGQNRFELDYPMAPAAVSSQK